MEEDMIAGYVCRKCGHATTKEEAFAVEGKECTCLVCSTIECGDLDEEELSKFYLFQYDNYIPLSEKFSELNKTDFDEFSKQEYMRIKNETKNNI